MDNTIIIISIFIVIIIIYWVFKEPIPSYHSHMNTLVDDHIFSTKQFYLDLEKELKSHNIDGLKISAVNISTGNALSHKRVYLRVRWKNLSYDCCCAPFGKGTFFSWWLLVNKSSTEIFLSKIPLIGNWLVRSFYPVTYFTQDTTSMFMTYAQHSFDKVLDETTKVEGLQVSE